MSLADELGDLAGKFAPAELRALLGLVRNVLGTPPKERLTVLQRLELASKSGAQAEADALRILGRGKF